MELSLDDFNGSGLALEDFSGFPRPKITLHHRTAANSAATNALLTGTDEDSYKSNVARIVNGETRGEFIKEQEALRLAAVEEAKKERFGALADPTLSDETRALLLDDNAFQNTVIKRGVADTMQLLAESAALSESGIDETVASASSRYNAVDSIQRVIEHKRRLQEVVNGVREELNPTGLSKSFDTLELLIPFVEWIHWDQLERDISGRDGVAFDLMGTQKSKVMEHLRGLPPEELELAVTSLIDILQNNENVMLPDGNDLATLEVLENIVGTNDYSDFDRVFDNVISLLEIVGVAPLVRGMKRTHKLSKLQEAEAKLAREAEQFKAAPEPTASEVFGEDVLPTPEQRRRDKERQMEQALMDEVERFVPDAEPDVDEVFRQGTAHAVRTDADPASTASVLRDANPEQAREIHRLVTGERGEEAAQAAYGTTRTEALANDLLPEPAIVPSIPNKVEMKKPSTPEPALIRRRRREGGNIIYSDAELARATSRLTAGIENTEGMMIHSSSMILRTADDGTFGISARFSPVDNGFTTAEEALDRAEYAFRQYGFPRDSFKVLERQGNEWVEISQKDAQAKDTLKAAGAEFEPNEYAIKLDVNYKLRPEDVTEYELLTKPTGLWSRAQNILSDNPISDSLVRWQQGSLAQNLFDPSSLLPAQLVNAASVAVDKAFGLQKLYVDMFESLAKDYAKLPKAEQALIRDYIHRANREGIALNITDLKARGFSDDNVELLKKWRAANDAMWYAANADMVKTLRERGFRVLVHQDSDTKLVGRPVPSRSLSSKTEAYDARTGEVVRLSDSKLEELGDNAVVIEMSQPIQIDGRYVGHAVSHETPEGGYLRSLWDDEVVLNYRDGYYPVMYDANYFIFKKVKLGNGQTVNKVIAAARDRGEIDRFKRQIMESERIDEDTYNRDYDFRRDRRDARQRQRIFDEGAWSVSSNGGLTSQRVRGEVIKDAGADLHLTGYAHLMDPMEAVAQQVRQLSQRVSMRDYSTSFKRRWMALYGKYYDLPINPNTGRVDFPQSIDQLKPKNSAPRSMTSDGKTQFNYITALENGYVNYMDEVYIGLLHGAADLFGELGIFPLERAAASAGRINPVQEAKTAAFKLFISANPLRQMVIQRAQMLQLIALNPTYTATRLVSDLVRLDLARATGKGSKDTLALLKEVENSGIFEAVDAHSLIRHDLLRLADLTAMEKAGSLVNAPLQASQKVGFDWAEQDILLSSYLAHRDLAIKAGRNINNQREREKILGQSRAFTLNMNRSGEMAYSQNTLGLMMQFFSFRHKALIQPFTNKALTPVQKSKLFATNLILFGPSALLIGGLVNYWFDSTEPSPEKDLVKNGLVDLMLNEMLTLASGEEQSIDFGDLAPTEAIGMWSLMEGMISTSPLDILASSPAGSLITGTNPRVTDALKTTARFFVPNMDYNDPDLQVQPVDVVNAAMHLFSGYSNGFRANYAFHNGKKMSSSGRFSDSDVTKIEAAAQVLGFRTKDEEGIRLMYDALYNRGNSQQIFTSDDVEAHYLEMKRFLARRQIPASERAAQEAILREAQVVFGMDRPRYLETLRALIARDAKAGDYTVLNGLVNQMGLMKREDLWKAINQLPNTELRQHAVESMKFFEENVYDDPIRD